MHLPNLLRVATKSNHIMIELRQVRRSRQLGSRNATERMERRDIVQSLEELVHKPDTNQQQHITCAQNGCICRQRHRLCGRHVGGKRKNTGALSRAKASSIFILVSICLRGNVVGDSCRCGERSLFQNAQEIQIHASCRCASKSYPEGVREESAHPCYPGRCVVKMYCYVSFLSQVRSWCS
jgi:hypothetical protein